VVAGQNQIGFILERVQTTLRVGTIPNHVSKTVKLERFEFANERENRLQGLEVAVDVRYQDVPHGVLRSCRRGYS
jgi:hypothetical protein